MGDLPAPGMKGKVEAVLRTWTEVGCRHRKRKWQAPTVGTKH